MLSGPNSSRHSTRTPAGGFAYRSRTLFQVNGSPRSAGRARATFAISARGSGSIRRGRPPPGRGSKAAKPSALKAWINSATRVALARWSSAICDTLWPWNEANSSIARCCTIGLRLRLASLRRWAASPSLSSRTKSTARRPIATSSGREAHGRASRECDYLPSVMNRGG
jgi:hypothetical protein